MPSDSFDQQLYDDVMALNPHPEWKNYIAHGYQLAAENAARLAASRQRVSGSVSDEAAIDLFFEYIEPMQEAGSEDEHLRMIRELRAALTPVQVPEIPEGWTLKALNGPEQGDTYFALLFRKSDFEYRHGFGPTWQAALAAACTSAQEGGK